MTFRLGLTGSIGMGKSTTAQMFRELGCAVWDADAAVHRLYDVGGAAVAPLGDMFPQAVEDGRISRAVLRDIIASDPTALRKIEAVVHPLVAQDREIFLQSTCADIAVCDIPLLFETGCEGSMDAVACVRTSTEVQKQRVLARGGMSEADFDRILAAQMPNAEKCNRSDFIIETDTLEHARTQVQDIVQRIKQGQGNA